MPRIIIRQGTRILTPAEYQKFRDHLNPMYKLIADVLLHTGMRVEEFWDFVAHPHWYHASSRVIDMPKGSIKKVKALYKERTVFLTKEGCEAVEALQGTEIRRVTRFAMRDAFHRAAAKSIGVDHINPKMLRKTLVSWLVACEKRDMYVSASMGHSLETMKRHYLGLGFERKDIDDMQRFLQGWGEA